MSDNPNPLDRIRALAPADMTDDELGVAVLLAAGQVPKQSTSVKTFDLLWCSADPAEGYFAILRSGGNIHNFAERHPALSYDALLPIVREWREKDPTQRYWQFFEALDTMLNWPRGGSDGMMLLASTPRQLAEAFVTAAREVGHE
jgi:hypothetical protein